MSKKNVYTENAEETQRYTEVVLFLFFSVLSVHSP